MLHLRDYFYPISILLTFRKERRAHSVKYEKQDLKIQAMEIKIKTGIPDLILGESVAVNGVCLTVTKLGTNDEASFFISSETLDRTNLYVLIKI